MRNGMLVLPLGCALAGAGCSDEDGVTDIGDVAGTYAATTFLITPDGEAEEDVLAAGGSLDLTITASGVTSGTMFIPASIGGSDQTLDLAGTAEIVGEDEVQLTLPEDTFLNDVTFTKEAEELVVLEQEAGSATFTITLVRD